MAQLEQLRRQFGEAEAPEVELARAAFGLFGDARPGDAGAVLLLSQGASVSGRFSRRDPAKAWFVAVGRAGRGGRARRNRVRGARAAGRGSSGGSGAGRGMNRLMPNGREVRARTSRAAPASASARGRRRRSSRGRPPRTPPTRAGVSPPPAMGVWITGVASPRRSVSAVETPILMSVGAHAPAVPGSGLRARPARTSIASAAASAPAASPNSSA